MKLESLVIADQHVAVNTFPGLVHTARHILQWETNRRKVGMTSSHHGPYDQGYTRATMAHTKRSDLARASGPHKVRRSPDWSLQLDSMKSESLVIVDQNATVNTFPGLVHTARHTMRVRNTRSR